GSSLWRVPYDELERRCRACAPTFEDSLSEHVENRLRQLGESYEEEAFRAGISRCLETGDFVFLYVGRDLDERTRRIMTYLAEGPRMTFFGVEVDHYRQGNGAAVLLPRTPFVPTWITEPTTRAPRSARSPALDLAAAEPSVLELIER